MISGQGKAGKKDLLNILEGLLNEYGFLEQGYSLQSIPSGHIGNNYRICSKNGEYVLRIRHPQFSPEQVLADHGFLKYLRKNDFPCPSVVSRKNRETFGLTIDKRVYEMQKYISHNSNAEEKSYREISSQLACFLGNFHRLSRAYTGEITKMDYLENIPLGFWEKYFTGPLEKGRERYEETAFEMGGKAGKKLRDLVSFLGGELTKIKKVLEKEYEGIPRLINHNDFYGNNILFQEDRIAGLVDFDFCSAGIFYIDLIELLHGSMIWHDGEERFWGLNSQGKVRLEQGRRDLEFYQKKVPELQINREILKDLLKAKIIGLAWYPAFDLVKSGEDRLEVANRVEKTIEEVEKF